LLEGHVLFIWRVTTALKICSQSMLGILRIHFHERKKKTQMSLCGESQFDSQLSHFLHLINV
jgi:hypothetical protein